MILAPNFYLIVAFFTLNQSGNRKLGNMKKKKKLGNMNCPIGTYKFM
jgi:hypothetical protein